MNDIKLNYDDITIVPEVITNINSRSIINPYDENGYLPIFASCMSSVISIDNWKTFDNAKIRTVIPRTYDIVDRLKLSSETFVAISLNEAYTVFIQNHINLKDTAYICIDLANGHMQNLLNVVKQIKEKYGNQVVIMTGNIANPKTYEEYEKAGVDYARFSIGTGNCCSTSSNTGIHYPIFSLIKEAYEIKEHINGKCKIIADGGIRSYRDIQKALIYADYVMIGSLFNKAIESAGKTTYGKSYFNIRGFQILRPLKTLFTYGKVINKSKYAYLYKNMVKQQKLTILKEVYGMSTEKAQKEMNRFTDKCKRIKTSEGLIKKQNVEFSIAEWAQTESDYLRSAMSYTNSLDLEHYKNASWVKLNHIKYNI